MARGFDRVRRGHHRGVNAVYVMGIVLSLLAAAVMFVLYVWAARKDGEADRAVQERLGVRRSTRLGR